jgi:hypothetical protein
MIISTLPSEEIAQKILNAMCVLHLVLGSISFRGSVQVLTMNRILTSTINAMTAKPSPALASLRGPLLNLHINFLFYLRSVSWAISRS